MNRFFLVFILILATASNINAKNCKKGKQCGNSCISRDKECRIGFGSTSFSSSRSSGSVSSSITTVKHCAEGIPCGNTCIPRDKVCRESNADSSSQESSENDSSLSFSASTTSSQRSSSEGSSSYNSSSPTINYPSPQENQEIYKGNGGIATDSEFKKDNSAQFSDRKNDKKLVAEVGDEKDITNSPKTTTAVVADILDADIFQYAGKKQRKIKLYGIDAPEDGQPFYQEARDMLKKFTHKKKITAKIYSQDSDGTDMAVVFANGKNVNELMVKSGYAWVRRDSCEESFCDDWVESEEEAKSQGKGLWSDPGRIPPWVWK